MRLTGEQSLWFLDQLLTNKLDDLEDHQAKEALLLTPKGKIADTAVVERRGDEVLLAVAKSAERVLEFLQTRVFTTMVTLSDVSGSHRVVRVFGDDGGFLSGGFRVPGSIGAVDYIVTAADESRFEKMRHIEDAEHAELKAIHGVATFGVDFDETFLPQEACLERAVHFQKGCYLGQEAVAMAQRGRVPRKIRHVAFESAPALGAALFEGTQVGAVTSTGSRDGKGFGIAALRSSVPLGTSVSVGGETATVLELPGTEAGPSVPSARELRERLGRS